MWIGEAAAASGASARSLRFYEAEGLIVPGRCGNGYRDYCGSTVDRVRIVRSLLESGPPVRLIRDVLPQVSGGADDAADRVRVELRGELEEYRDRLASRIAALSAQRSALDAFLARGPVGDRDLTLPQV